MIQLVGSSVPIPGPVCRTNVFVSTIGHLKFGHVHCVHRYERKYPRIMRIMHSVISLLLLLLCFGELAHFHAVWRVPMLAL